MPWTKRDVERHKSGLSDAQKEQWVEIANSALASCLADGRSQDVCEASAIRQASGVVGNMQILNLQANNYTIRREVHQGRKHIVIPAVMMVEGVHHGSAGKILHLSGEFGKIPGAWNGIPVVVSHPEDATGNLISANSPDVIELEKVGTVFNTTSNGKLQSELWIDEERCREVSPEALAYINQGRPLEVSTGVFTDNDAVSGVWNGEEYIATARNHRPDHLALLPGETGACSWADGCGIRANQQKGDNDVKDLFTTMKELGKQGLAVIQINEQGYKEICNKIQSKLDNMDTDSRFHFLKDVFDGYFVYEIRGGSNPGYYQRNYQVNADETLEFSGEPAQVIQKVEYQPIQANSTKGGMTTMADEKGKKGCCPEQVNLIVQSKHTRFEETDREWLETLEEKAVIKLLPIEPEPIEAPQINKEQAIEVLKEQFKTPEQFLQLLPQEMRDQMQNGLRLHQEKREKLIDHITTNSKAFTAAELKDKDTSELEKLATMVKAPADYSALGAGGEQPSSQPTNMVLPMGVEAKK